MWVRERFSKSSLVAMISSSWGFMFCQTAVKCSQTDNLRVRGQAIGRTAIGERLRIFGEFLPPPCRRSGLASTPMKVALGFTQSSQSIIDSEGFDELLKINI